MIQNNLPVTQKEDSAASTKLFFDTYGTRPIEFNAIDVDASIGFFTERGFGDEAAIVTGMTILKQAKIDGVPVFELLDSIKHFDEVQLTQVVAKILNNNRVPTSLVGYRDTVEIPKNIARNIRP